jgi:hypothetical protein
MLIAILGLSKIHVNDALSNFSVNSTNNPAWACR